jgi:hypothetical protein
VTTSPEVFSMAGKPLPTGLGSGEVNIRELAEYMGHSDPAVTLRTYIHLLPSAPDRARKAVDRALAAEDKTTASAPRRQRRR